MVGSTQAGPANLHPRYFGVPPYAVTIFTIVPARAHRVAGVVEFTFIEVGHLRTRVISTNSDYIAGRYPNPVILSRIWGKQ